jgi:hypothetical protein
MHFGFLQIDLCVYFEYKATHFTTKIFSHKQTYGSMMTSIFAKTKDVWGKEHNIDNSYTLIVKSCLRLRMKAETLKGLMQKCL